MQVNEYFKDKVVIVTGASSGIGLASARLFGSLGAYVVMAARSYDKLCSLAPSVGAADHVLPVRCDVSSEEDCKALVEAAVQWFGGIDILVNNAGLSMRAMFKDLDLQVIHRLMDVNFWGTVNCTKYAQNMPSGASLIRFASSTSKTGSECLYSLPDILLQTSAMPPLQPTAALRERHLSTKTS